MLVILELCSIGSSTAGLDLLIIASSVMGRNLGNITKMILGVFKIVLSDPLAGGTVTATIVDRLEHFLNIWRYFQKHFDYGLYVSIQLFDVNSLKTSHVRNMHQQQL